MKVKEQIKFVLYYLFSMIPYVYIVYTYYEKFPGQEPFWQLMLHILLFYLNYILVIIIHETGHLIFGLISGYKFVSFRIFNFVLIKEDNCYKLKKSTIPGTAGQCLMCPPSVSYDKCPYKIYHLGGGLLNVIFAVILLVIYCFVPITFLSFIGLFEFGILSLAMGIINLMPLKVGGIQTGGYNILDISKNDDDKRSIYNGLLLNAYLTIYDKYDDVPKKFIDDLKSIDYSNMKIENANNSSAYYNLTSIYLNERNYDKYYEIIKKILSTPNVLEFIKNEARCEELFYEIFTNPKSEQIKELYNAKLKSYIKKTIIFPSRQRLMYTYNLLYKNDLEEANKYYEQLKKSVKTYATKADANLELDIANEVKKLYEKIN